MLSRKKLMIDVHRLKNMHFSHLHRDIILTQNQQCIRNNFDFFIKKISTSVSAAVQIQHVIYK